MTFDQCQRKIYVGDDLKGSNWKLLVTYNENDLDKNVRVDCTNGFLIHRVPKRRTVGNYNGHVKGGNQYEPIPECLEGSIMRKNESRFLLGGCFVFGKGRREVVLFELRIKHK